MSKFGLSIVAVACLVLTGCLKPYHEQVLVDVGTSEVAFLIETINENGQASIAPPGKGEAINKDGEVVDYYRNRMVNAKKVEIPYYWKQTHRVWFGYDHSGNGEWRPAARFIVVDTQPQTREWSETNHNPIWVESMDSVGFSTGISITARIEDQEDGIRFLSNYPPKTTRSVSAAGGSEFTVEVTSLEQIMDQEVRTKIQEVFAYEAAAYKMDELREKKREIMDHIKETVIPYFADRGITITTIGQFGGFEYENPATQEAIDKVFQAQQDEEVAIAESKAAEQRKVALKLLGEGEASKILEAKKGEAEGIKAVADAKAYELQQLQENPEVYLKLKEMEIEQARIEKWSGDYPQFLMGSDLKGSQAPTIMMNMETKNAK